MALCRNIPMAMLFVGTLVAACSSRESWTSASPDAVPVAQDLTAARTAPVVPTPNPAPKPEADRTPTVSQIEAVRSGRYTLVELTPEEGQRDPMRQIVVITIPPAFESTLGSALTHVLTRTGYKLCSPSPSLVHLPLPASQLHLGPMTLAGALQTLAGPAWSLTVDHLERRVCFIRNEKP